MQNPEQTYHTNQGHLNQAQLLRYGQEEMGDTEMHQAELHLLHCSLCSDAVEGMAMLTPTQASASVIEIKDRLAERLAQAEAGKGPPAYYRWGVAATVLFLCSTVIFLLVKNFPGADQSKVIRGNSKQDSSITTATPPLLSVESAQDTLVKSEVLKESKPSEQALAHSSNAMRRDTGAASAKATVDTHASPIASVSPTLPLYSTPDDAEIFELMDESIVQAMEGNSFDTTTDDLGLALNGRVKGVQVEAYTPKKAAKQSPQLFQAEKNQTTLDQSSPNAYRSLKGQITDPAGQPIPGVNVIVKNRSQGTITDIDGKYTLTLPKEDTPLIVSFIGYLTYEETVGASEFHLDIVLKEDIGALSEVVVTGYGTKDKSTIVAGTQPMPVGGFSAFKIYLKKERRYTPEAKVAGIEGTVVVVFKVNKDGSLTGFQIKKSLGYGLDQEAIRLLEEGARWKPGTRGLQPVELEVKVKIPFKLEK